METPCYTPLPPCETLREWFEYSPETGEIFLKKARGNRAARAKVGSQKLGYLSMWFEGVQYQCHRVIWKLMTGDDPKEDIDHINGIRNDNRWGNLREASRKQNIQNTPARSSSELGVKNVRKLGDTGKFQARVSGKSYGCYNTLEEAHEVATKVRKGLHREFAWRVREDYSEGNRLLL